jgi:hypothetical protein
LIATFVEDLCRQASLELRLNDSEAMGREEPIALGDVTIEVLHQELNDSLLVLAELGQARADEPAEVYEQLLSLQYLLWHQPGIRFGYREEDGSVVLMLGVPLREDMNGEWLARALSGMAEQVEHWRDTLLSQAFTWDARAEGPVAQEPQGRFDACVA